MKPNHGVRERDQLYRMMISQLFYDGYQSIAVQLSNAVKAHPACPPSDKLLRIAMLGVKADEEANANNIVDPVAPGAGIDLEFETEVQTLSPEAAQYETCYVTAHKAPCRTAIFHHSGQLIATGSEDTSIKILDVDRMLVKSTQPISMTQNETPQQQMENHPVIRTLYDHVGEVTCLAFHPTTQILASGSKDFTLKFFEYSKPSVKKAFKSIHEAAELKCLDFHPSGDFLLAGTEHPVIRLYDANTLQCFVANNPNDQHEETVTSVKFSPNGALFASASMDGTVKIWDSVSNKCINTFKQAHDGAGVSSVRFTRNSKYVLSSGRDSMVKLWELSTSRCLIAYTGAGTTGKAENDVQAVFNHTEDYVLFPDEKTISLCCWDSRNADRQKLLALGHNAIVRGIDHSPTSSSFVTCSDDFRARFWYRKSETD